MMADICLSPASPHKGRVEIETKVPYETVKEAVTLFGERADLKNRLDWIEKWSPNGRAHSPNGRGQSPNGRGHSPNGGGQHFNIAEELRRLKEQLDIAEREKVDAQHKLSKTHDLLAEVTSKLCEALASKEASLKALEEANSKVKQAENAKVKETEEKYLLCQAELEELKKKRSIVLSELDSAKEEIERLRCGLQNLNDAKSVAEKMVEEAQNSVDQALQKVEELANNLSESQKVAAAECQARLDVEHARLTIEAAREAESKSAAAAAEEAQKEIKVLKNELAALRELESQILDISARLEYSNKELVAMKETNCHLAAETEKAHAKLNEAAKELEKTRVAEAAAISKSGLLLKELDEVREKLQKLSAENVALMATVESIGAELNSYKSEVESLRETEASLLSEAAESSVELNRVKEELAVALAAERKAKESIDNLRQSLQQASADEDESKVLLERAHEDLKKSKVETEQAKAMCNTLESRLQATYREAEAAKAAEEIASAEVTALKAKLDEHISHADTCSKTTVPKEEYEALRIRLQEAVALANEKVSAGLADLGVTKAKEQELLTKLEEAYTEIESSKSAEKQALKRAENAEAAKFAVEGELRRWRAENEQRRRATGAAAAQSPLHSSSARPASDMQERAKHVESLGQVLHIKFPTPADRVYPAEKQPSLKKKQKLLARIRSYLAKKRNSLKSFKRSDTRSTLLRK